MLRVTEAKTTLTRRTIMALPTIQNAPAGITPEKVTGDGGGEWSCSLSKDGLKIETGLRDDAVVTVRLPVKGFVSAVTGELKMGPPGGAKAPSPEQAPGLIKDALTSLRQINGILRYHLEDADKGDFVVDVKFAGPMKDDADVSVTMARETAENMAKGELNPQAAFMAGQVQISGDMTILMQLMPLMNA
jgi:hypothetical protein